MIQQFETFLGKIETKTASVISTDAAVLVTNLIMNLI